MDAPGHELAGRLSECAMGRLAAARTETDALLALGALVQLLDPTGTHGRWAVAGQVATRLRTFERAAWQRIRRGGREPRGTLEALLARLAASDLPRSRRRLMGLLD